ncbi:TIGR03790 family protein [Synechococcus sp. CS-1332]|uniref:TIGR03790 family protein n=1 Tax=Synechococcus sp. CS-1332 TaxID=2847972 RepID=UPI00223C5183|nr:TIGR03790 family protein [Synechococcus sp. CS-1332]MCT0208519.1 TIGR03790 family protein [Synechococcus sp. CS-1332]
MATEFCVGLQRSPFRRPLSTLLSLLVLLVLTASQSLPRRPWLTSAGTSLDGPLDHRHLAIIINAADPLSETIGRAYQGARLIPPDQVIRVRFPPRTAALSPAVFRRLKRTVDSQTPGHVQVYALAWAAPYRVGCQSITSAFTFGLDPRFCASGCRTTALSPLFARGDVRRPWDQLGVRPSMLLAATSLARARRLIQLGVASDGTAPPGTAYLLSTRDARRNTRAAGYGRIVAAMGSRFRVKVVASDALVGAQDVMAYFTGLAFPAGIRTNLYRPGAIADHLTSFGGQLTDSSQMSALRWLEAGATGSYGTVVEPCNFPAKFSDPGLLLTYYRRGDTLIESYWRSVAMPGQGVFIGEPLARPWPVREELMPGDGAGARPRHAR